VRDEADYPDLDNPLHFAMLAIACDTEIAMNGMLGFLENMTGRHVCQNRSGLGDDWCTRGNLDALPHLVPSWMHTAPEVRC
jgi:hypothetical protein